MESMDRSNLHGLSLALVPQPASGTGPGVGNLAGQWNGYRGGYSGPTVGTVALQWVTVGPTVGIQPKQWLQWEHCSKDRPGPVPRGTTSDRPTWPPPITPGTTTPTTPYHHTRVHHAACQTARTSSLGCQKTRN